MITKSNFIKRLSVIILLVTFLFIVVSGKLFYVQIIDGESLRAKALDQWTRDIPYLAERGGIFDRNGILLAGTTTSYTCYVRPSNVEDYDTLSAVLSKATGIEEQKIYDKIHKKGVSEITVAKKMTKDAVNMIIDSNVSGIYFSKDIERYYPYGDFASQLIGFCNADKMGQSGLELFYNDYLKGVNGAQLTETDIIGRQLNQSIFYLPSIKGAQLELTIDKSIQYFAESALDEALKKHNAKSAACIVMDVTDGGIVAMAQSPSFDLNNLDRSNIEELFERSKLSCVCNAYETGSVFKIITMAAALEEGLVDENESFSCPGYRIIDGQRIKCWKSKGHGQQTFAEGVMNSCNCVFMDLALRLGVDKLYEYYERFNFTRPTEIDFTGEGKGLLIAKEKVKTVDLARMGFGQAIAVTPIELISAVTAIIGDGVYKTPHILSTAYDYSGKAIYEYKHEDPRKIISQKTAQTVRKLLLGVVSSGSGKLAGVDGYLIGGKTGTAQKYGDNGIDRGKYLSSFIGFLSVDDPKYVVYLYVDEPQGYMYYGSQVAAPLVGEIFKKIVEYEKIEPTQKIEEFEPFIMPDLEGLTYLEAKTIADPLGVYIETDGEGETVREQFPPANTYCQGKCVLYLKFDDDAK